MFDSKSIEKRDVGEETETKREDYVVVCQRKANGLDVLISNLATKEELSAIVECISRHYLSNANLSSNTSH